MRSVLLAVASVACAAGNPEPVRDSTAAASSVAAGDVRTILQLQYSGWDEAAIVIAEDAAAFAAGWEKAHAGQTPVPTPPSVDFVRERAAFVAAGTRSSGGFVMSLDSVRTVHDTLVIGVLLQTPGERCGATAALTQPAVILALPRSPIPPRIAVVERAGPPC